MKSDQVWNVNEVLKGFQYFLLKSIYWNGIKGSKSFENWITVNVLESQQNRSIKYIFETQCRIKDDFIRFGLWKLVIDSK